MKNQLIQEFIKENRLPASFIELALNWFIPLAERISEHQKSASKPMFVGLNGCQGAGKSTLTNFLKHYLKQAVNLNVAVLSLDDFYLTQQLRSQLADEVHPLLKTRGVPGTHDVELLKSTLDALESGLSEVLLPRFNKATDNPFPMSTWPRAQQPVDVVIFEGWCWGTEPQSSAGLELPVNQLEQKEDPDGLWRHYVNQCLTNKYLPLYTRMDFWIQLKAPGFDCVYDWRLEQEHKLAQSLPQDASGVMTDEEVHRFIQHYQRLTERVFSQANHRFDVVLELNEQRQIVNAQGISRMEPALE